MKWSGLLVVVILATFSAPKAVISAEPGNFARRPARYFVKFRSDLSVREVKQRFAKVGLKLRGEIQEIQVYVAEALDPDRFEERGQDLINSSPDVLYLEKDRIVRALESYESHDSSAPPTTPTTPNDPKFQQQKALMRIAPEAAWSLSKGSRDVLVAVTDTGVALNHPELKNQVWTNSNELPGNGIDDDRNGFVDDVNGWNFIGTGNNDPEDDEGHGTHVAGIIGAEGNNSEGIAGVNWLVSILPVKFLDSAGSGTLEGGVRSILYAVKQGARLINASWGDDVTSRTLQDAIEYAFSNGSLVIAAAANSTRDTDVKPNYPSSDVSLGVISVASSSRIGTLSGFSNYGVLSVDLVAPGSDVLSTYLRGKYAKLSGTSMAAPMVTGIGALMLSLKPELSVLELRNGILNAVEESPGYEGKISTRGDIRADLALEQLQTGFQIWPSRLTIALNAPYPLTAYRPEGSVQWDVSDESLARIDANGVLTFLKAGGIQVRARDGSGKQISTAWTRGR
ncbi:MAG TPA: S8 family peptidase [Bdellovibrionota bacterium]|nr:S8 family peptidase [Bdellovibrionota bacterium]